MSFDLIQFVKQQESLFTNALTDQSLTWAKECQFAIQLFQRNDTLAKWQSATRSALRTRSLT